MLLTLEDIYNLFSETFKIVSCFIQITSIIGCVENGTVHTNFFFCKKEKELRETIGCAF